MLNLVISVAVALVLFVVACFAALQVAPDQRGSTAGAIRIAASCLIAIVAAGLLYIYLEG